MDQTHGATTVVEAQSSSVNTGAYECTVLVLLYCRVWSCREGCGRDFGQWAFALFDAKQPHPRLLRVLSRWFCFQHAWNYFASNGYHEMAPSFLRSSKLASLKSSACYLLCTIYVCLLIQT